MLLRPLDITCVAAGCKKVYQQDANANPLNPIWSPIKNSFSERIHTSFISNPFFHFSWEVFSLQFFFFIFSCPHRGGGVIWMRQRKRRFPVQTASKKKGGDLHLTGISRTNRWPHEDFCLSCLWERGLDNVCCIKFAYVLLILKFSFLFCHLNCHLTPLKDLLVNVKYWPGKDHEKKGSNFFFRGIAVVVMTKNTWKKYSEVRTEETQYEQIAISEIRKKEGAERVTRHFDSDSHRVLFAT